MWDLIVSVPDHCLSFYFSYFPFRIWDLIVSVPDHCLSFYMKVLKYITIKTYQVSFQRTPIKNKINK